MRVCRTLKKSKVDNIPPLNNVELTSPMPTVSTLTTPPTVAAAGGTISTTTAETEETSNKSVEPDLDEIWLMATGKAKDDGNKKCLQQYKSAATKMATKMYYEERQKEGKKKSAEEISKEVKKHTMELGHQRDLSEGT